MIVRGRTGRRPRRRERGGVGRESGEHRHSVELSSARRLFLLALVVSMCAILLNFLSIGAYPIWSSIAIVGSCLVLWAVTVHSDAFE